MGRYYSLDLLRGFAAIAVVLYHGGRIVPAGYFAVDLFFILSGFVIAHAYGQRVGSSREIFSFLLRRAVRLYPVMLIGALVGLTINGGSLNVLLLIPESRGLLFPANVPLWSLLFEACASLAFGLFFRFGAIAWAISWAVGLVVLVVGVLAHGSADLGFSWATVAYGLGRTAFDFCSGIAIYKARRSQIQAPTWVAAFVALVAVAPILVPRGNLIFDLVAVTLILPAAVGVLAHLQARSGVFSEWLGNLSYPLYAIHHPLIKLVAASHFAVFVVTTGLIFISAAIYQWYDIPVRRWLGRKIQRRRLVATIPWSVPPTP